MSSETVVALNSLEWKPTGCGMVADCFAEDTADLERAIFNLGVSCAERKLSFENVLGG